MLHGSHRARRITRGLRRAAQQLDSPRHLVTLAIETSCDDTCVAILEKGSSSYRIPGVSTTKLHFHEKITVRNTGLGGIHPLEALDSHCANLSQLVSRSLKALPDVNDSSPPGQHVVDSNGTLKRKPDFVSVTRGPGMRSNLNCGLDTAKGLSVAWQVPLLAVHHMQAHALTPRLVHAMKAYEGDSSVRTSPDFPFLTLLVSGGHTILLHSTSLTTHKILATTADIAIGDALDKSGRLLLPDELRVGTKDTAYGKYLSEYAFPDSDTFPEWPVPVRRAQEIGKPLNRFGWQIQAPFSDTRDTAFSFTSIATSAARLLLERTRNGKTDISSEERLLLARTVLGTAFEHLGSRVVIALDHLRKQRIDIPTLVVSGGVASNDFLRYFLRSMLDIRGYKDVELVFPPISLCTDNAAMIAWTGMEMFEAGYRSSLSVAALRKWSMDAESVDGGILGVGGWTRVSA